MVPGSRSDASALAAALAQRGRVEDGYRLLQQANVGGDAGAAATLAEWRLTGDYIRRDLALARDLFGRAASLGHREAGAIHIALLANGAGGAPRQWQQALSSLKTKAGADDLCRRQVAVLQQMSLDSAGDPASAMEREALSADPRVESLPGFLSRAECDYLIQRAKPLLEPSLVVHPSTGRLVPNPVRSSTAAVFSFVSEDPAVHAINRRIAAATATSYEQGEPLQVLSYTAGQQYKLHSDALPPGDNQRILTFLVYLNEDFKGGETEFPDIGIKHRGRRGDGLLFANVDAAGRPEQRARHAGLPVRGGRKWLLSKWIRERPLDLSGPPGRPF